MLKHEAGQEDTMQAANAVRIEELTVRYGHNTILSNVNLSIPAGRMVGVMGPNGAGKSTLVKACMGLIPRATGRININGKSLDEVRGEVAYIPQRTTSDWDFPITVLETVMLGSYPRLRTFQRPSRTDREHARECLDAVGMNEYATTQLRELSGGQAQRVFTARALMQEATVFFLDEPFVGIDAASQARITHILKQRVAHGATVIVVHHDLNNARLIFDDIVLVNRRIIANGATAATFTADNLSATYGPDIITYAPALLGGGENENL
ncbi:metal ABC transporter ATP-binding protein [Arthrobacter sp. HMSC06H05]|uniref:metal ABC transporter ATP-binding protein n=1 Tax=Arthrobacter sp. HMSC06H05 TaxID=1581128 RepID=UPI001C403C5D|nr:metal ABC transporter ATP-binding protein [Arthrobacter sp. HMSC06H05]